MLLHAVRFFLSSREVDELEIQLLFPLLQMSWKRWSWRYRTGNLHHDPQPAFQEESMPPGMVTFFLEIDFRISFFIFVDASQSRGLNE